jgi:serine/threonine-protein kinase
VVAYELITGRRPFADAEGPEGLITAALTRVAAPPSSLVDSGDWSRAIDPLLLRCLERDADQRFANVVELATAIEEILAVTDGAPAVSAPWATPRYVPGDELRTWVDGAPPAAAVADASGELAAQVSQSPARPYLLLQPLATLLGAPPPTRPARPAPAALPAFEFLVTGSSVGPPPRPPTADPAPPAPAAEIHRAPVAAPLDTPPVPARRVLAPTHPLPPRLPRRQRLGIAKAVAWAVVLAATGAALGVLVSMLAT